MPFQDHMLVQVGGRYGTQGEEWSATMRFPDTTQQNQTISRMNDVVSDWRTFLTSVAGMNRPAKADYAVSYHIPDGSNGKSVGPIVRSDVLDDPAGGATPLWPLQSAVVATLETGSRLRPRTGRWYLPIINTNVKTYALDANGRLLAADVNSIRAAVVQLVNNLNNWPGLDPANAGKLTIYSKGGIDGRGPQNKVVTSVRVGDVVDTMRSRRRQTQEFYSAPVSVA